MLMHRQNLKRYLFPAATLVVTLVVVELTLLALDTPSYLVPRPTIVLQRLLEMDQRILMDLGITSIEALLGFAIAVIIAFVLAVAFVLSRSAEVSFMPYVIGLRSVPIIAIAPLLVLWLGNGIWSKVAAAALLAFFAPLVNLVRGMRSFPVDYGDLFRSYGATKTQTLLKLRIPWSLPYFFASLRMAATLAVIGAIVGEFCGADHGIGQAIIVYSYQLDTAGVFVALLLSGILSLVLFAGVVGLERLVVFWPTGEQMGP